MTEEYKQSIVDSIIAQRQLADNDPFVTELNGYVKENISDSLFIAKVNTALKIYDTAQSKDSVSGLGMTSVTKNVFTNALNDAIGAVELEGDPAGYAPGQYDTWLVNTPLDVRIDVFKGMDISAGVIQADESQEYFDYLIDKLDDWYDSTGQIGALVKPGGGKGVVLFSTDEYDKYKKNYDNPEDTMQIFRDVEPGRTKVPKQGFRAEPTVLYEPIMSGDPGNYEFSGEYNDRVKDISLSLIHI